MKRYQASLTLKSSNSKTGPIPVSVTSARTCPKSCPLSKGGCYAQDGPLAWHWRAVTEKERGAPWSEFCGDVSTLIPDGQLWRHNAAGDLPGDGAVIDTAALELLTTAQKGKRGFTYTHYRPEVSAVNRRAIKKANAAGFTVNLSANNLSDADALAAFGIAPVVVVLPVDAPNSGAVTPGGRRVVTCPATYKDTVSCATCKLCSVNTSTRPIVGFPAHGAAKRMAGKIATG